MPTPDRGNTVWAPSLQHLLKSTSPSGEQLAAQIGQCIGFARSEGLRYFTASPGRNASQFPATARTTPSAPIHVQR